MCAHCFVYCLNFVLCLLCGLWLTPCSPDHVQPNQPWQVNRRLARSHCQLPPNLTMLTYALIADKISELYFVDVSHCRTRTDLITARRKLKANQYMLVTLNAENKEAVMSLYTKTSFDDFEPEDRPKFQDGDIFIATASGSFRLFSSDTPIIHVRQLLLDGERVKLCHICEGPDPCCRCETCAYQMCLGCAKNLARSTLYSLPEHAYQAMLAAELTESEPAIPCPGCRQNVPGLGKAFVTFLTGRT